MRQNVQASYLNELNNPMKKILPTIALLIAITNFGFSQSTNKTATDKLEQEIIKLEQERVEATTKGDTTKLEQLFADELVYTHSNARVESKQDFLNSVKTGSIKYESMKHSNVKVTLYGNTAVMRGESDIKVISNGQPVALRIRFLNIYVKKDGRWQMTAWQSTRLP
jgi:hypothetical protein